jgi:hypothetical protein
VGGATWNLGSSSEPWLGVYGDAIYDEAGTLRLDLSANWTCAGTITSGGTAVSLAGHTHDYSGTYLGISAKAADSDLLDSHDTSYFATSGHNHDAAYISVISSPAANHFAYQTAGGELVDSTYDAADFATAAHGHTILTNAGDTQVDAGDAVVSLDTYEGAFQARVAAAQAGNITLYDCGGNIRMRVIDGGVISLRLADESIAFRIDASGNDPVNVMVSGGLHNVTEGAADSGGAGYKVLRVPN